MTRGGRTPFLLMAHKPLSSKCAPHNRTCHCSVSLATGQMWDSGPPRDLSQLNDDPNKRIKK